MRYTSTDEKDTNYVRALVHGDSGIGKTTSLKTLPKGNTLIAKAERSLLPLQGLGFPVVTIDEWEDVRQLVPLFKTATPNKGGGVDVVMGEDVIKNIKVLAIDSLTEINEICARHIVQCDRKSLTLQRTTDRQGTEATDEVRGIYADLLTMEDYGLLRKRMGNMISAINQLPVHVIFTSLSAWVEDKLVGRQFRTPALYGKFAHECPRYFDLVMHMEAAEDGSRVWRTANDGSIIAKDASANLDEFEETDWTKLLSKIAGKGK